MPRDPFDESTGKKSDRVHESAEFAPRQGAKLTADSRAICLVERRRLVGECIARCISAELGYRVKLFADIEALRQELKHEGAGLGVALTIVSSAGRADDAAEAVTLEQLDHASMGAPVIILSDSADLDDFCRSLACGARGHVPTNLPLDVCIKALRLVLAGGVFVPADPFMTGSTTAISDWPNMENVFTRREGDVVDALRRGKPTKEIAYDLNMSESTVKVHIHNIMKKLGAKNRTEAAIKIGEFGARIRAMLGRRDKTQ